MDQSKIYQYLEDLQKLTSQIPAEIQQRIPNELLSDLATSLGKFLNHLDTISGFQQIFKPNLITF